MNERQAEIMDYLYSHPWSTTNEILENVNDTTETKEMENMLFQLKKSGWIKSRVKKDAMMFGNIARIGNHAKPHEYTINEDVNRTISVHDIKRRYGSFVSFLKRRYR